MARRCSVALDIRTGISDVELRALYDGAVSTLYLAREEPLGLASLEAQACGSPVVVADDGGLPETMIAGETGWTVGREDTEDAARAIDALENPELMRAMSARAREHGRAHTWQRSTTHVEGALERAREG
jgi:glycosyltransferase involved in cell wall biosynthesis